MEKSIRIIYDIVNPDSGKRGTKVVKAVAEEIGRIHDAVECPISTVVINCRQVGGKPVVMPAFEELTQLRLPLQIDKFAVRKNYSRTESASPLEILEELRRLHDELGEQIGEIEEDFEDAVSALQSIYDEMETQLDALDNALDGE